MNKRSERAWLTHINAKFSEADLVAEFYHQCRLRNWHCYLEVRLTSFVHRSGCMRADAVIKKWPSESPVCAVEFKTQNTAVPGKFTRQHLAYSMLPFPFFYCIGAQQIFSVLGEIENLMGKKTSQHQSRWDEVVQYAGT